jgi:hypothetical protein
MGVPLFRISVKKVEYPSRAPRAAGSAALAAAQPAEQRDFASFLQPASKTIVQLGFLSIFGLMALRNLLL